MAVYDSKYNGAELDDALDDALSHIQDASNPHNVTKSQVGLGNVGNFKAVSTEANQGLTSTEKSNARANIGACSNSDYRLSDARVAVNIVVLTQSFYGDTQVDLSAVQLLSDYGSGSVTFIYNNETSTDGIITVPTTYTGYTIRTPDGNPIELTCPAGGYCEISVLKNNLMLFIRGI